MKSHDFVRRYLFTVRRRHVTGWTDYANKHLGAR